ncbi:MAG: hypothetical protein Q7P63_12295 [Verrucomicrobiota bacterium JB022]|nr:hypothetical protein [Verrucomicrobiota bacterium JB022]
MKITRIIGEDGPRTELCAGSACPAFILTESGEAFVQGTRLSADEAAQLSAPAHETFVKIPVAVLQRLAAQLDQ